MDNQENEPSQELGDAKALMRLMLAEALAAAERIVETNDFSSLEAVLGDAQYQRVKELADTSHAARGVALTLAAYKAVVPSQDVRAHKADHPGGFSARKFDTAVTVPFLNANSLPSSVETHWLSQSFAFAGPYLPEQKISTSPRRVGPLLIEVMQEIQSDGSGVKAGAAVTLILARLIAIRNAGKVQLTRPKLLTIDAVLSLMRTHVLGKYNKNAPRLPQLAIYAAYQCLLEGAKRYEGMQLEPIKRMKSADRKSGTVGDVVVSKNGTPVEAIETKLEIPIGIAAVSEAISKIKSATVQRYYILSTVGIDPAEEVECRELIRKFRETNGCEIVINGVFETLSYYLRLLPNPADFVIAYTALLESDPDLDYEHRLGWNTACETLASE